MEGLRTGTPLVSIALCTYNGERFLPAQLGSILKQTYRPLELVVVDDVSTDGTLAVLENVMANAVDIDIKIYRNSKNLGYAKNFEKAISLCTGEFIALSDQDDIWRPEKISVLMARIKDSLLIYHDSSYIDESGNDLGVKMSDTVNMYEGKGSRPLLLFNCVSGHSCLFHKTLRTLVFPIPPRVFHDWWIAYHAASYGTIAYIDDALVQYRRHAINVTNFEWQKQLPDDKKRSRLLKVLYKRKRAIREANWLKACAASANNPDVAFAIRTAKAASGRLYNLFNFGALLFLLRYNRELFWIKKQKANRSNAQYIFDNYFWGIKAKWWWYNFRNRLSR